VWELATTAPFVLNNRQTQLKRLRGLTRLLDWLQEQPGATWQQRWLSAGAETAGAQWRRVPLRWLAKHGFRSAWLPSELSGALTVLISADVLRPSLDWLVSVPPLKADLAETLAVGRDLQGFARLNAQSAAGLSPSAARLTFSRAGVLVAAKGGLVADITVGDVLELADAETSAMAAWPRDLPAFYRTLLELGVLGADAPTRWRQLRTPGQRTPDEPELLCSRSCHFNEASALSSRRGVQILGVLGERADGLMPVAPAVLTPTANPAASRAMVSPLRRWARASRAWSVGSRCRRRQRHRFRSARMRSAGWFRCRPAVSRR
jgi:hypothetical protein